jgi:hypothetical protein
VSADQFLIDYKSCRAGIDYGCKCYGTDVAFGDLPIIEADNIRFVLTVISAYTFPKLSPWIIQ